MDQIKKDVGKLINKSYNILGLGIKRIYDLCQEDNVKVDFVKDKVGFRVVFYRKNVELEYIRNFDFKTLTEQEKTIILHLEEQKEISRKTVDELLKTNIRTSQRILKSLIDKNIIISSGGSKNIVFKLK